MCLQGVTITWTTLLRARGCARRNLARYCSRGACTPGGQRRVEGNSWTREVAEDCSSARRTVRSCGVDRRASLARLLARQAPLMARADSRTVPPDNTAGSPVRANLSCRKQNRRARSQTRRRNDASLLPYPYFHLAAAMSPSVNRGRKAPRDEAGGIREPEQRAERHGSDRPTTRRAWPPRQG